MCNAQLHLQTAYRNFFRDASVGFPKFKSKKKPVRNYTTNYVNGNIVLQNGKLKLPKAGWVRMKQHRKIEEGYQLKGATITQEVDDRYYVARSVMPYEHNGSSYFVVGSFCGAVLHRQSFR